MFVLTKKGKRNPVDASTWREGETHFKPGQHVSHFATCPKAQQFRKGGK